LKEDLGDNWVMISKMMGDMDPIKVRNRYYSQIIRRKRKDSENECDGEEEE